jgi:hypothetical protein
VSEGNWQPLSGYEAARALMNLKRAPTAIFCANDLMAVGCYEALHELGLRIPDEVVVTGTKSSPRRLRSIATSQCAGRSPSARNHSIDGARKQGERLRIRATGQLIASFGHAGEAQAKLGATLVAQKVQWSLVRPSRNRALTESGMRNSWVSYRSRRCFGSKAVIAERCGGKSQTGG